MSHHKKRFPFYHNKSYCFKILVFAEGKDQWLKDETVQNEINKRYIFRNENYFIKR
jgi:hypothetical protein